MRRRAHDAGSGFRHRALRRARPRLADTDARPGAPTARPRSASTGASRPEHLRREASCSRRDTCAGSRAASGGSPGPRQPAPIHRADRASEQHLRASIDEPSCARSRDRRGDHALSRPRSSRPIRRARQGKAPRILDLHQPLGTVVAGGQKHGLRRRVPLRATTEANGERRRGPALPDGDDHDEGPPRDRDGAPWRDASRWANPHAARTARASASTASSPASSPMTGGRTFWNRDGARRRLRDRHARDAHARRASHFRAKVPDLYVIDPRDDEDRLIQDVRKPVAPQRSQRSSGERSALYQDPEGGSDETWGPQPAEKWPRAGWTGGDRRRLREKATEGARERRSRSTARPRSMRAPGPAMVTIGNYGSTRRGVERNEVRRPLRLGAPPEPIPARPAERRGVAEARAAAPRGHRTAASTTRGAAWASAVLPCVAVRRR